MKFDNDISVEVPPEVYEPSDDSFLLLRVADPRAGESFLEIGAGSGIVSLHAAKLGAKVTATDLSPHAVECVRRNAARNNLRVKVILSDLFDRVDGEFDVIVFNPPYLPSEGKSTSWIERSWAGGEHGSETAVRFIEQAWKHLAPGGRIYLILSSLTGVMQVLRETKERYESVMVEEKHLFFESVFAYRLVLRHFLS